MTAIQAKRIVADYLDRHRITYTRLSAKAVGFTDLARSSSLFVTVHGWANPHNVPDAWDNLRHLAHQHGFCMDG